VTSTTETVHGLLRLEEDRLVVQWRLGRRTETVGATEVSTDREYETVREVVLPLASVAGARVRRPWWSVFVGPRLVLRAADLQAFDAIAGGEGLRLDHPAELVLRLRRKDLLAAEEFTADLALALAQLESGGERRALEDPRASRTGAPGIPAATASAGSRRDPGDPGSGGDDGHQGSAGTG